VKLLAFTGLPPCPIFPTVHLLATGGTISGGQQPLDAAGLAAVVPGAAQTDRAFW
jgi:hypothetical protein